MSAVCQVTGRKPGFGKQVSHSHRRTSRRWNPNIQRHRYFLAAEGRWITLTLSVKGMKTIDKRGIESVVARRRGEAASDSHTRPSGTRQPTQPVKGETRMSSSSNDPDRLVLRKFDPVARRHVEFKEER